MMVAKNITKNNLTIYEKRILVSVLDKLKKDLAKLRLENMNRKRKKKDLSEESRKIFSAIDSIKNKLRLYKKYKKKK